jgi:hypothetical protein
VPVWPRRQPARSVEQEHGRQAQGPRALRRGAHRRRARGCGELARAARAGSASACAGCAHARRALSRSARERRAAPRATRTARARGGACDYKDDDDDEDAEDEDVDSDDADTFDPLAESNTAANALFSRLAAAADDPLGESVNVVNFEASFLGSTRCGAGGGGRGISQERARAPGPAPTRDGPPNVRARPLHDRAHARRTRARRCGRASAWQYIVAGAVSEESRYALEREIGTVLRDGDEMPIVNVNENESKGECASVPRPPY